MNGDNGLLPWHMSEMYRHGQGDCLVVYFLRELFLGNATGSFVPVATTVMFFASDIAKCVEKIWNAPNIQTGLFQAMQEGCLSRIFDLGEIDSRGTAIKKRLTGDDWGDGNDILQDSYIGSALRCIWDGFRSRQGCSFLLYACRSFVKEYFSEYNEFATEWREQNRPWDYDHILPKDWGPGNRISNYSYLVRKFLWSIGNSAPLPFSLNRSKNADAPDHYPDGTEASALHLHVDSKKVNEFGQKRKNYDRLDRNKDASAHFIETTFERIKRLIEDWYNSCAIDTLLNFDNYKDRRRQLFEAIQDNLASRAEFAGAKAFIGFVHGDRQYPIRKSLDWARAGLACGLCGTIQYAGKQIQCLLGVASNGQSIEIGIRRHPEVNEIPGGEWWVTVDSANLATEDVMSVINKLLSVGEKYSFVARCEHEFGGQTT